MAILPIRRAGDPVLREKARRVRTIDRSIQRLIEDMWETMYDAPGVGLAAPQIGIPLRVVVIHTPDNDPLALVNPEIVKRSGERILDEGCLSVPGYRGEITDRLRYSPRESTRPPAGKSAFAQKTTSSPKRLNTRSTTSMASSISITFRALKNSSRLAMPQSSNV